MLDYSYPHTNMITDNSTLIRIPVSTPTSTFTSIPLLYYYYYYSKLLSKRYLVLTFSNFLLLFFLINPFQIDVCPHHSYRTTFKMWPTWSPQVAQLFKWSTPDFGISNDLRVLGLNRGWSPTWDSPLSRKSTWDSLPLPLSLLQILFSFSNK